MTNDIKLKETINHFYNFLEECTKGYDESQVRVEKYHIETTLRLKIYIGKLKYKVIYIDIISNEKIVVANGLYCDETYTERLKTIGIFEPIKCKKLIKILVEGIYNLKDYQDKHGVIY